jgi:hypothetical protein
MMKAAHDEDRQRHEWRIVGARDDVGRRCELTHVEFDVPHHAPISGDLRLHVDELRLNALEANVTVFQRRRV